MKEIIKVIPQRHLRVMSARVEERARRHIFLLSALRELTYFYGDRNCFLNRKLYIYRNKFFIRRIK